MTTALAALAPPDVRDLVSMWLEGRCERTRKEYRSDLDHFAAHIGAASADDAAQALITAGAAGANRAVLGWRSVMLDAGLASATINRRLSAIRSVLKLARIVGAIGWAVEVEGVRNERRRDMTGPSVEAVRGMVATARQRTDAVGLRNAAILALLVDLGLRRAEVAGLDVEHVDAATVRVLRKGHRERVALALPKSTGAALAAWMAVRPGPATGPLFLALDPRAPEGARLSGDGVYDIVRRLGFRRGIQTSPHRIRHASITTVARRAAAAGLSLGDVTAFSGHANPVTLGRYLDRDSDTQGRLARMAADAFGCDS